MTDTNGTPSLSTVRMNLKTVGKTTECATTLEARDYKGFVSGSQLMTGGIEHENFID